MCFLKKLSLPSEGTSKKVAIPPVNHYYRSTNDNIKNFGKKFAPFHTKANLTAIYLKKIKLRFKTKKQLRVLKTIRGLYSIYAPSINTTCSPSESHETVPSEIAKLNPVFKTGDSLIMDNYPPKTLLNVFSKYPHSLTYIYGRKACS
jgi:hypothetical protein